MAIHATVKNKKKFSNEEILDLVRKAGIKLIELTGNWKGSSPVRPDGFEDALVSIGESGKVSVTYRDGDANFQPDKFGFLTAHVPRTDKNMARLAGNFKYNLWTIVDERIRDEVKKMSDALVSGMSEKDRKADEKRIHDLTVNTFGDAIIAKKKDPNAPIPVVAVESGVDDSPKIPTRIPTRDELAHMKYFEVQKIARDLGIPGELARTMVREKLVAAIEEAYQTKLAAAAEAEPAEVK